MPYVRVHITQRKTFKILCRSNCRYQQKIERHNLGMVRFNKQGLPWQLVLTLKVSNRSEAMLLEKKIKKRGAKRYIDDQFGV